MKSPVGALALERVGRDGALRVRFDRRGLETVVSACRFTVPLQVLAPLALDDAAAVVSVLNPTGGLVGGDRLMIEVDVGPAAHGCVTTPAATQVYRTLGEPAVQDVTLRLEAGACLEWVPGHTIPFAGSAFRQAIRVELAEGARLILIDGFAAGRIARDEAWRFASLESSLSARDAGGWVLRDRFLLDGSPAWQALGFAEEAPYFATVALVADAGFDDFALDVAALVEGREDARAAVASLPRRGALVRCLAAAAPALAEMLEGIWRLARRRIFGRPGLALRKT